jgi:hypothetical protein
MIHPLKKSFEQIGPFHWAAEKQRERIELEAVKSSFSQEIHRYLAFPLPPAMAL